MGEIRFTLSKTLETLNISPNKLSVESKTRYATIKTFINNEAQRITVSNLKAILDTLNQIAAEKGIDKKFNISDIIDYVD